MESYRSLSLPLSQDAVLSLSAGDAVLLSGVLYTARDAAHKRLFSLLQSQEPGSLPAAWPLPAPCAIYYAGALPRSSRGGHRSLRPHHQRPHGPLHPPPCWTPE